MGKGSAPRPYSVDAQTFASNWERTFTGHSITVNAASSNLADPGSIPGAPARYIDDATGSEVDEAWWPEVTEYAMRGMRETPRKNAKTSQISQRSATDADGKDR